ncbi:MAG TPA: DUF2961 domain-containing protein [Chthonomonadaceae bacterium]|nr:DUF2961 domain-containing protein [Chthonomonadaceae bacterium]
MLFFALSMALCGTGQAQEAKPPAPTVIEGPGSTLSQMPRPKVPASPRLPYGLQLMARFDLLPLLRDTRCVQDSSFDRSGGNGGAGHFLRVEGNKAVLADIRGPGCIYRFWSANATGQLRIYFDGEAKPRLDCPMQDFFLGKVAPFVSPLVGHRSGGWYSFFPMPFAKSCRIEVTDPGGMYYQVQYQLFPDGTPVRTFTPELTPEDQRALAAVLDQWNAFGFDPKPPSNNAQEAAGQAALAAGASRTLATLNGPAEIGAIRLKLSPADRFTLRQTVLRVYWDGAKRPGIEAPVGDFFGVGFGDRRFKALPAAMTDEGYVCFWPMPFARSARLELVNTGRKALDTVSWKVSYMPLKKPMADAGYFHAQWHRQTTTAGEPFHILQTSGRGHYVGTHTDMQGDRGIGFLEGDEQIYVDGEAFPSIHGTGTEDFYTGGWYFDEGPFSLAYHGCTIKDDSISRVSAYRYQIQDCVPFQRGIKVDIEHGGKNDYPGADYACVAYWYQDTPEHTWSPIDVAQLTPATMKMAGVTEIETLSWTEGRAEVRDDTALEEEASGGKFVALDGGLHTFQFQVKADDVYVVGLGQPAQAGSARLGSRWWLDGDKVDDELLLPDEGTLDKGERHVTTWTKRLTPGAHTATISVPPGKTIFLDYLTLGPSEKVAGAIEAESLLEKADTGGKGTVRREDATLNWSGRSALKWRPAEPGAALKLPLTIAEEADYALELGVSAHANGPQVGVRVDDGEALGTLDTYAAKTDAANPTTRIPIGRIVGMQPGAHTLTLVYQDKNAAAKQPELWLDYLLLRKSRYPHSVEAETLKVLDAKDGQATHQEMKAFGSAWSNDGQFWFLGQKAGAEATLELPVQTAGRYELSVYYTTSRDYAIVQVLVDGQPVGEPTDTYSAPVLAKGKTTLGTLELTAGAHRITFRAVGKNANSTGYLIGVDALGLEPVK